MIEEQQVLLEDLGSYELNRLHYLFMRWPFIMYLLHLMIY